ncbi:hypothetical protein Q5O14_07295 [Eubacteriaceae bacterium ES2]|nr:hypothetical protein Q5O14_07295 [Eubacteriaceae bacterium ES2]
MKKFAKQLIGYHQRLGDLMVLLETKGYILPFACEKIDPVFRNSVPGKNSIVWNDKRGNVIVVEYAIESFGDNIEDTILTVIDANYIDIDILSSGIRDYLKK